MERFELPNLGALNFLLHQALGGGGTVSLRTDAQGKTFGAALLRWKLSCHRGYNGDSGASSRATRCICLPTRSEYE